MIGLFALSANGAFAMIENQPVEFQSKEIKMETALEKSDAKIEIHLAGFRNGEGRVAVSVFRESNASSFPRKPEMAIDKLMVDLNGRQELTVSTRALPAGRYAVAVFHDENSDGKLATNFLGIPKEGFGFSNNPAILFGPPPFQRASFALGAADADVSIRLKYFL